MHEHFTITPDIREIPPTAAHYIQSRAQMDFALVDEYAQMMRDGVEFEAALGLEDAEHTDSESAEYNFVKHGGKVIVSKKTGLERVEMFEITGELIPQYTTEQLTPTEKILASLKAYTEDNEWSISRNLTTRSATKSGAARNAGA